jgi:adrenodoxin-NADP+ reductase
MKLSDVAFRPIHPSQLPPDISRLPRAPKRIMQVLAKGSEASLQDVTRSWSLDFQLSPTSFNPDLSNNLASLSFDKTSLGPEPFDPNARAKGTGEQVELPAEMAFRSIGYKAEAIAGLSELGVPFDDRLGIIPNDQEGRVLGLGWEEGAKQHVPGMYAAGWVKRGPTGVIASTMSDAFLTADRIADDWHAQAPFHGGSEMKTGWEAVKVEAEKRGCRWVSWEDWKKIDAVEVARGKKSGKKREKFTTIKDMLRVLD